MMKQEYNLHEKFYFRWLQVLHSIPKCWKQILLDDKGNCQNLIYLNHHLIKNNSIVAIEKLIPAELYSLSIVNRQNIPTSQKYYKNLFPNFDIEWKDVYILPRKVTIDTKLRMF